VAASRDSFTYIGSPNGPRSNVWSPLGMSNTNAMKQLRGPKHENWPVCDPRAAPPGECGLKSGENGHLARANGAIDGPYCSPTWPSGFGKRCEPLAGRGGGCGGWQLHQRPHAARGALLPFECLSKTRGVRAGRPPLWRKAMRGMA
jgi:hypothetical protein